MCPEYKHFPNIGDEYMTPVLFFDSCIGIYQRGKAKGMNSGSTRVIGIYMIVTI
jgi:hypothetical protein